MSFHPYEMKKLIPVYQFVSQFSITQALSFCKPITVPSTLSSYQMHKFCHLRTLTLLIHQTQH